MTLHAQEADCSNPGPSNPGQAPMSNPGMARKLRQVTFSVNCTTNAGETVCVVGNCPQLGNWKHEGAFPLQRKPEYESAEYPEVWSGVIGVPLHLKDIKFRYFVCMILDSPTTTGNASSRHVIVRRWETNIQPRVIQQLKNNESPLVDSTGGSAIHVFGRYGGDDAEIMEHGWLTAETIVQFKVSNNPIQFWRKKYRNVPIRLHMVSVNLARGASISEIPDGMDHQDSSSACEDPIPGWPIVEVAVLNEDEHQLSLQQQFGRRYTPGDIMIFQAQVIQPPTVAYMIDFYADTGDIPQHIGFCHILPSNLKDSIGMLSVPITSVRQEPLGQITVEYIVVKPLINSPCDMKVSYSRYWKHQWKGLDIGHRGAGNSGRNFQSCANIRENTIASLQKAGDHGADFVEFDVQLSKDLVPVLFHDFHVNIGLHQKAKKGGELTTLKIPVKDLTLNQLHELKVYHLDDDVHDDGDHHDDDHDPFPTLEMALTNMPSHVGFNVEIKWTMQLKDGSWELENPFELNMYLDIVLQTVLKHGAQRRVVFSCFHPDICTMMRLKQNKYPVLFLTQGVTNKWPEYSDPRTSTIAVAINYARFAGILGLSVHTEDILRDPSQVKEIKDHGLIAFCWGDDNNNAANIKYLKELGMDGVIFDRIDDVIDPKTSVFFVEHQQDLLQLAVTSPAAEFVDMDEDEGEEIVAASSPSPSPPPTTLSNVISYSNEMVSPGKQNDIDAASLFPNIANSLNLGQTGKEWSV